MVWGVALVYSERMLGGDQRNCDSIWLATCSGGSSTSARQSSDKAGPMFAVVGMIGRMVRLLMSREFAGEDTDGGMVEGVVWEEIAGL